METSNTVLEMCDGNVFPACPSAARGGTDSSANFYPNKNGLEKLSWSSQYIFFLARSNIDLGL